MATTWAPARHFTERSVAGLIGVLAAGTGFGALLLLVRVHWGPMLRLDRGVAERLNHLVAPHPAVVSALTTVTRLGGRPVLLWLTAFVIVLLLIRRQLRLALYLFVAGIGALLLDPSLKALVGRVRPVVDAPVATAPGNSFPSGHTLGSTIVYGALVLVFLPAVSRRWRPVLIAAAGLLVLVIGLTRMALGVHFLTDVLAGWLLGVAWLGVSAYAFRIWRRETGRTDESLSDGLEPEARPELRVAPAEDHVLPHPWRAVPEILTGWVLTFGLLYLLGWLVTKHTPGFDNGVPRWLQSFRTPALDHLSWLWSKAGDTHTILAVSLIACPIALAAWRQWRPVLFLVLAMFGELTLFLSAAAAVGRPRPEVEQLDGQIPTSSFPSGHIAATLCLWSTIALIAMPRVRPWWRWIFLALAIVMPVGVAVSRMYRGEHHPTDVLGAVVLAGLWLTVLFIAIRPNEKPEGVHEAAESAEAVSV
jgi:undecaprenyl-diphosphatase